ncbi:MAG: glycosyltransferase family A protein [Proteobacteria bacterium]|nr:glycosyltransferase family A protein [Pseudomonadota bacterium]
MAPLVSVIIPTYNREKIITRAIDSVFAQTYRDFEIVVLDDGSQDNTKAVAQAYGPKMHYFYQDNKGIAGARNAGMHQTAGDYIAFLDSDDYWLPGKLERQMALFSQHPEYGMVGCQCGSVQIDGTYREKNRPGKSGWILYDLFNKNFIRTSSAVITRACLEKVGGFDESLREGEEYDYWLRIAAEFAIGFINEPLTVYVDNTDGMSTDSLTGRLHRLKVLEKKYLKKKIPLQMYRRRIADTCHYIGRHYIEKGSRQEGIAYLKKAQKLYPAYLKNLVYLVLNLTRIV